MTDEQKTCCYRSPPDDSGACYPCQFTAKANLLGGLVEIGDLTICPYHLPYSAETLKADYGADVTKNNPNLKENWPDERVGKFNAEITKLFRATPQPSGMCNLTGVMFPEDISPGLNAFPNTKFFDARFHSTEINFDGKNFGGPTQTDFSFAQFCGDRTQFEGINFGSKIVSFRGAQFNGSTSFESAIFNNGPALFSNTEFSGDVSFRNALFLGGSIEFEHAQFKSRDGLVDFSIQNPNPSTKEHQLDVSGANFKSVRFSGPTDFSNRVFTGETDFGNGKFGQAPKFQGCTLHQETTFPKIEGFQDTKSKGADHAYRTLRRFMKQQEGHEEEAMFWALEQKSKRKSLECNPLKNWRNIFNLIPWSVSAAYATFSDYGLSINRPLISVTAWLAAITPFFYFCFRSPFDELREPVNYSDLLGFSIAQSVRPFFIWGDYNGSGIKSVLGENISASGVLGVKLFATADSLISLILIALLILAVRRRFRMQ